MSATGCRAFLPPAQPLGTSLTLMPLATLSLVLCSSETHLGFPRRNSGTDGLRRAQAHFRENSQCQVPA